MREVTARAWRGCGPLSRSGSVPGVKIERLDIGVFLGESPAGMLTNQDSLSTLRADIARAAERTLEAGTTMPPAAYTSPELLEFEIQELFTREWICLGRVEEIPAVGDYFTIVVAGEPLLVVRSEADTIRVLSNVCRHKWTRIASGSGCASRFVCPYHAWTYDLDGQLVHTRYMDTTEGFDPSKVALPLIRSEIWRGFIYVNIAGDATPVSEHFRELDGRIGDYHMESMHRMCGDEEVWATNWKQLFENFTDLYHVFHTHRDSIAKYSPTERNRARYRRRSLQLHRLPGPARGDRGNRPSSRITPGCWSTIVRISQWLACFRRRCWRLLPIECSTCASFPRASATCAPSGGLPVMTTICRSNRPR